MSEKHYKRAYVVTDQGDCFICHDFADEIAVFDDPADIVDLLLQQEQNVALFIDVKYYIKLGAAARNRLMAVAQGVPLFRIRLESESQTFVHIDDPRAPRAVPERESQKVLQLRQEERIPAQLNAELAREEDPFLQEALRTSILNISCSGCFIYCAQNSPFRGFTYIRIHELSNKRPIYCNIRWRREWGVHDTLPGMGLQFVDIQPDQAREIQDMYITPYLHALDEYNM